MAKRRFDIRRRELDGKFLRWELMSLREAGTKLGETEGLDGKKHPSYDHVTWVCVGVFDTRKAAFNG